MVPPAPTVFSTSTVWPSDLPIGMASMRATTSVGPPAAKGTTSVTGLSGYAVWAAAGAMATRENAAREAATTAVKFSLMLSSFVNWPGKALVRTIAAVLRRV